MARLIDSDALSKEVGELWRDMDDVDFGELVRDFWKVLNHFKTVDAIPVDWLERRLNETAEATAQGDDQTELNNAIFQVLVEWEKERRKNGKA